MERMAELKDDATGRVVGHNPLNDKLIAHANN